MIALEGEKEELDVGEDEEPAMEEREMKLTLNLSSVVGFNTPKTMKFVEFLKGEEVVTLLDGGATYNFISRALMEKLRIPMTLAPFAVTLGDEKRVKGMGRCDSVELQF